MADREVANAEHCQEAPHHLSVRDHLDAAFEGLDSMRDAGGEGFNEPCQFMVELRAENAMNDKAAKHGG